MPQNPSSNEDAQTLALMSELQQTLAKRGVEVPQQTSSPPSSAQGPSPAVESGEPVSAQDAQAQSQTGTSGVPRANAATQSPTPLSAASRFLHGMGDEFVGLGQVAEHTPVLNTVISGYRDIGQLAAQGIASGANAVGMHGIANAASDAALGFAPQTASQFDRIVNQREADYENARTQANQTGIDWWRIAGEAANPINYLGGASAAEGIGARIGGAALQGAGIAAAQPVNTNAPGGFWWAKAKDAAGGAIGGGVAGAMTETLLPALRAGTRAILGRFGSDAPSNSAQEVVNKAMADKGLNPQTVPTPALRAMASEVDDALHSGAEPNATAIANRLKAESLPVPVHLMRGQATRDSMQFSQEQNLASMDQRVNDRVVQQNQAFLDNLDALGAKNAPDYVTAGNYLHDKLQSTWDSLTAQKNALYSAVRNNQGQSARMDGVRAALDIREMLDSPEASHAFQLLPNNIQQTVADLEDGKFNLTVAQMQNLDHTWGQQAAGASDGSVRNAIYQAREILGNAKVDDDLGADARQAYQKAKAAHAQQMSLVNPKQLNGQPNANFQPLMKSVVDGKPSEGLYSAGFSKAPASVAAKNLNFMRTIDPNSPEIIGKTLMGEIKRSVTGDAKGAPVVSEAKLRNWADEPGNRARLQVLMPKPQHDTFQNLVDTVENAKKFPVAHGINVSHSGTFLANQAKDSLKRSAIAQAAKHIMFAHAAVEGIGAAKTESQIQKALTPGVTLKSLIGGSERNVARQNLIRRATLPSLILGSPSATQHNSDRTNNE